MHQITLLFRNVFVQSVKRIRRHVRACCTCRECATEVSPMSDYCPACGSRLPGLVPVSPPVLITALCSMAALLLLKFT